MEEYKRWRRLAVLDADVAKELADIENDPDAIRDRFFSELSFGTGGLRGVIGAGTNRMNIYTVARATNGLYDVIAARAAGETPTFVIAHDTRKKSDVFARSVAELLARRGARVYLYDEPTPVPLLSYTTRALSCDAGICITASHNPAIYNGYKVYAADGGQLLGADAALVLAAAKKYDYFSEPEDRTRFSVEPVPSSVPDTYFEALRARRLSTDESPLSIVYTPLNGTGLRYVPRALKNLGFSDVTLVAEQAVHDGNFPTCPRPNPEMPEALALAVGLAKEKKADLVLATDPDCDRVGIAVPDHGDYRLLTGNETGILLLDYVLSVRAEKHTLPHDPVVCTTVVSTEMADPVAKTYGASVHRVLTGFKYIGDLIHTLEQNGQIDRFVFGFEESYGYLAATDVRDKDGVEASTLICEMARHYRKLGMTLYEGLQALYARYGTYLNKLCNFEFFGEDGAKKRTSIMDTLRFAPPASIAGFAVTGVSDYKSLSHTENGVTTPIDLPQEDMLAFSLASGNKLVIRPSGTEPKIKIYLFAKGKDEADATAVLQSLEQSLGALLGA